jgi:Family of unknown function (DUF5996)
MATSWPEIPYPSWAETCSALHLWTQVVGKYRLARTPWLNHSWHATLYVDAGGLTTGLVPDGMDAITVRLDFRTHRLAIGSSSGATSQFGLEPMSLASFHSRFLQGIRAVGGTPVFHGRPNEIPEAIPFAEDDRPRPYDRRAVERFHEALVSISAVFSRFRTGFIGKSSPVHLFWGSFDLAVTRFSGRAAPLHPGGIPNLPDAVTREAYSHEVSSAGFWPGGQEIDYPAFYSYAYPAPAGFDAAHIAPPTAFFHRSLGEFILKYEDVRAADDPESVLMNFLETTYQAAVESRCGAVAVGVGCLLPPLSSGGARVPVP